MRVVSMRAIGRGVGTMLRMLALNRGYFARGRPDQIVDRCLPVHRLIRTRVVWLIRIWVVCRVVVFHLASSSQPKCDWVSGQIDTAECRA